MHKKIEQINNLQIYEVKEIDFKMQESSAYQVETPDKRVLEIFSALIDAEKFCKETTDFSFKRAETGKRVHGRYAK